MNQPEPAELETSCVRWPRSVRIVSSRFPPVGPFDRVASSAELEAIYALEAYTNERMREAIGELGLVPQQDRVFGAGTTPVMAAFTHPAPSRFSDGTYGVYYCAFDARTAVRETVYHRELFLMHGGFEPLDLEMREYLAPLAAELHELRGQREAYAAVYDAGDYTASQVFGRALRTADSWGVVYDSVRDPDGGWCAGIFRPPAITGACRQRRHLLYRWNGRRIEHVLEVTNAVR